MPSDSGLGLRGVQPPDQEIGLIDARRTAHGDHLAAIPHPVQRTRKVAMTWLDNQTGRHINRSTKGDISNIVVGQPLGARTSRPLTRARTRSCQPVT